MYPKDRSQPRCYSCDVCDPFATTRTLDDDMSVHPTRSSHYIISIMKILLAIHSHMTGTTFYPKILSWIFNN